MKSRMRTLMALVALFTALITGCSRDRGSKIVIKGSTTVLPIAQKATEEYRKTNKVSFSLDGSGSGNGIKSLIDGTCDIADSSREMKPAELDQAKQKGETIKETLIGYDMIVPVVHPSNTVKNLTLDQLKGIYDGSISNWKDVGGPNEKIIVISRDTSSGTFEVWHEKVMKKTDVRKDALTQASNGAIIDTIAGNPKAIGYVGYGYVNASVKGVMVNGVAITIENGKSGKFPLARKLYMYTNEKKATPEARAFLEYVVSPTGQKLVQEAGFIPLQ